MCLGIPMKIVSKDGDQAVVDLGGVERRVSVQLVGDVAPGDYVIVHAGFAIEKLDEADALQTLGLIEAMLEAEDQEARDAGP